MTLAGVGTVLDGQRTAEAQYGRLEDLQGGATGEEYSLVGDCGLSESDAQPMREPVSPPFGCSVLGTIY